MPTYPLRVNNRDLTIERPADDYPTATASEVLDRADFDPAQYALYEDIGGGVEFADRAGDRLGRVALDEHEQVIARRTYD